MSGRAERGLIIADATVRRDAEAFVRRVIRVSDTAFVRLRLRNSEYVEIWALTGFDVLATRMVAARLPLADVVVDAGMLLAGLVAASHELVAGAGQAVIDTGFSVESAWAGILPPRAGFRHVEDVPAHVVVRMSRDGAHLARDESGPRGPAAALLDQNVLSVSGAGESVQIPMRALFALTAMGFVGNGVGGDADDHSGPHSIDAAEVVRIRASPTWVRIDAQYGSVAVRRERLGLDVIS